MSVNTGVSTYASADLLRQAAVQDVDVNHADPVTGATTAKALVVSLLSSTSPATIGNVGGLETAGSPVTGGGLRIMGKDGSGNAEDVALNASGQTLVATRTAQVQINPANNTGAYVAGNVVGGKLNFANALGAQLSGIIESISVVAKTIQTTGYKLYLFSQDPANSTWTDHAAPNINVADLPFLVDVFTLPTPDSGLGTMTINQLDAINKAVVGATTSLYGILVCTGTPTYGASANVYITLGVLQD